METYDFMGVPNLPHKVTIIPLILSGDPRSFSERVGKSGGRELVEWLASRLNGEILPEDILAKVMNNVMDFLDEPLLGRPCVFCLFFEEHAPMKLLEQKAYRFFQSHVAAFPIYIYLPSLGSVPFKIKLEEVQGLNYGRPFNLICLSDNWKDALLHTLEPLEQLIGQAPAYYGDLLPMAQRAIFCKNANLFRLPYLRMFREDLSISIFYAGIEYVLMLMHAFVLIHTGILPAEKTSQPSIGPDSIHVPKSRFSDGFLFQRLGSTLSELDGRSPFGKLLQSKLPSAISDGINKLLLDLGMAFRLKRPMWMDFIQACLVLRNSTKGHGVTYYMSPNIIHVLINGIVRFTAELSNLPILFHLPSETGLHRLDITYFIYFARVDSFTKNWLTEPEHHLVMKQGDTGHQLFPYILYYPGYDFFLYCGTSMDGKEWYYKNYASGIYMAIDSPRLMKGDE